MRLLRVLALLSVAWVLKAGEAGLSAVHIVSIDYPFLAHMAAVQGPLEFMLSIGRDGLVRSIRLLSGPGLLVPDTEKVLKTWRFSPCTDPSEECQYPMSVLFVLRGGPLDLSKCKTVFEFNDPGHIVVTTQYAWAIVN